MPSPKKPSPAFPLYAGDVLADSGALSVVEMGILYRLTLNCWRLRTLPGDHERLARLAQVPRETLEAALPALVDHVYRDGDAYRCTTVEKAVVEQAAFSEKQRQRVNVRWSKSKRKRIPRHTAVQSGIPRDTEPYPSASASDSDRASDTDSASLAPPAAEVVSPTKAFTAGWGALFERHRGGARYAFEGGKDAAKVRDILKRAEGSVDEALRRAEIHLTDPFWAERGASLSTFLSQWNRCVHGTANGNGSLAAVAEFVRRENGAHP